MNEQDKIKNTKIAGTIAALDAIVISCRIGEVIAFIIFVIFIWGIFSPGVHIISNSVRFLENKLELK